MMLLSPLVGSLLLFLPFPVPHSALPFMPWGCPSPAMYGSSSDQG
jgi:hypothetical protein